MVVSVRGLGFKSLRSSDVGFKDFGIETLNPKP